MKETLRDLRKQSGKTAVEVAAAVGVAVGTYFRYEQGTRQISIQQVLLLAKMFDCTEREIIEAQLNSCQSYLKGSRN